MRKILAILICKILKICGNKIGHGSSLPGKIALRICPDILKRISLPNCIIAVTGSNGKTSTVEMIAKVLKDSKKTFSYNKEGSNQIEGVTTFILSDCNFFGKFKKDAILMETDERFAKYTFKFFVPTHYVITNLYRDQLTRNGHPEFVYNCILESIKDNVHLILNSNDPLVSMFSKYSDKVTYFSADETQYSEKQNTNSYIDYKYCPVCSGKLSYKFYHFGEIGQFHCDSCGYSSKKSKYTVTSLDLENKFMIINDEYRIPMNFCNIYTAFNILSAFSVCAEIGINSQNIISSLSNYKFKSGRTVDFKLNSYDGKLLVSKHENSISYDNSINIVINQNEPATVLFIVDSISRKYFTSEVSWLWDINFERLKCKNIKNIILSGTYCYDLANRFNYCGIESEKIKVISDILESVKYLKSNLKNKLFVITCFSDKDKFLLAINKK